MSTVIQLFQLADAEETVTDVCYILSRDHVQILPWGTKGMRFGNSSYTFPVNLRKMNLEALYRH